MKGFRARRIGARLLTSAIGWVDSGAVRTGGAEVDANRVDWIRVMPFLALHVSCVAVLWTGASAVAVWTAVGLYLLRMLAITGAYHRYFSHRTYRTSRFWQFVFALIGCSAAQRGPLWWAAHHRHHHKHADEPGDPHSPRRHGFLYAHMGWFTTRGNFPTRIDLVPDWRRYPELVWLDRFSLLPPIALALALYAAGAILEAHAPGLGTTAWQMLVWGFCVSTVVLFHATALINSLDHMWGRRRFATPDDSRNSFLLAILTLGEGWHNNHHHYPAAARQGFYWWELDPTYWVLRLLSLLGVVRKLRPVSERALGRNRLPRGRGAETGEGPCASR